MRTSSDPDLQTSEYWALNGVGQPSVPGGNAGRNVGYSGVTVWTPQGQLIGRIRLPEICGNVCFGGAKRNRLFMAASQSLYAVYTGTQGAAPG